MIFDWIFYINRYPELYNQGINTKEKAIKHWCYYGINQGKKINKNQINLNLNKYKPDELYNLLLNNKLEHFDNIKFKILTSKLIESIALNMQNIFNRLNISSTIIYELSEEDENNDEFYIIIYNNFNKHFLPKKYILYVIEQTSSKYFRDNNYLNMIKNADYIWDFCVKNRKLFIEYPFSNYYYLACPFVKEDTFITSNKYDILFYGSINNRRRAILDKLTPKYNIYIANNIKGAEKDNIIKQSKIILNLHYYYEAGLETCRLNEVLKYNKLVISELPFDDYYNTELYKKSVVFIDNINDNLSNIENLYNIIDKYLENDIEYNKKINDIIINNNFLQNKSEFNIQKLLLPLNLGINKTKIVYNYDLISDKIYCLHLVETPNRIKAFNKQKNRPDVEIFPAIKYNPGWRGCALSYVNLIYNAKRFNFDKFTICEDDCRYPDNFDTLYTTINDALNKIKNWDIFVGCVADLPKNTTINNVYKYKNITFIEIDKMNSNVFNIYNKSCYDTIINWDFNNKDNNTNTIDTYIQKQNFKIIITYPFYFDCLNVESTLWGKNLYDHYNNLFQESLKIIKNKLDAWDKPIINLD
jgi:hypothetical protein